MFCRRFSECKQGSEVCMPVGLDSKPQHIMSTLGTWVAAQNTVGLDTR
jgi:hypothetical protein